MKVALNVFGYANSYIITLVLFSLALCGRCEKRKFFLLRLVPVLAITAFMSTEFYPKIFVLDAFVESSIVHTVPYLINWFFSVVSLFFCFRITLFEALLYQSLAYLAEHSIFNIRWIFNSFVNTDVQRLAFRIVLFIIRISFLCFIYFFVSKKVYKLETISEYKIIETFLAAVNVSFVLLLNNLFYNEGWFTQALHFVRLIVCVVLFILPFLISRLLNDKAENQKLQQMLVDAEKQQNMTKESIEAINHKCHDLKYQIAALRHINNVEEYNSALSELERNIVIYDSIAKMGRASLDLLITEKNLICKQKGIDFTYMVDNDALSFINEIDLYTLFGNALDNAIEATLQLSQGKRVIILHIYKMGEMTKIELSNSCVVAPQFVNGLPKTTKEDERAHGFGTKSIKQIAEKYGGFINMAYDDGRYILKILFSA